MLVQGLHQFEAAARTVVAFVVAAQIADVAFHVGIAPDADQRVHAGLVDHARVGLHERLRPELHLFNTAIILEALGAEQADAAAAENVIDQECRLAEAAARLVVLEVEVLETAEGAGLHVAPAIDQTDIELAFLPARVVACTRPAPAPRACRRRRTARRTAARPLKLKSPVRPAPNVGPMFTPTMRELLVAPLRFVHRARWLRCARCPASARR